jgi:hypothetical protein
VIIERPTGLTAQNATACFALTFINDSTGACHTKVGTLRADNTCWCVTPIAMGLVNLVPGVAGTTIGIGVHHPCDPAEVMTYRLSAVWLDPDHEDPGLLSLNGLPPGTPVTGSVNSAAGHDQQINVNATLPQGYDLAARYEILLEADTDGDGVMEQVCGTVAAAAAYDSTERVAVPPGATASPEVRLLTSPNPFVAGTTIGLVLPSSEEVDLGVCDLSGRVVRTLQRGRLAGGPHRFEWNGRNDSGHRVAAGVYFVHLDGSGRHLQAKLVKLQ